MVKKAPPTTSNGGQNGGHHLTSIGIIKFTFNKGANVMLLWKWGI